MFVEIQLNEIVELRKSHACGGNRWLIVRTGVDVGLVCQQCQHRVTLDRSTFNKRFKKQLAPPPPPL